MTRHTGEGLRFLVVEDEAAFAMLLEDMLDDFGYQAVAQASRLERALEILNTVAVDAALPEEG